MKYFKHSDVIILLYSLMSLKGDSTQIKTKLLYKTDPVITLVFNSKQESDFKHLHLMNIFFILLKFNGNDCNCMFIFCKFRKQFLQTVVKLCKSECNFY